jgi:anionic cell wall polymer biosynthesis LytR-Cps2A-Psr (LCP) family protein
VSKRVKWIIPMKKHVLIAAVLAVIALGATILIRSAWRTQPFTDGWTAVRPTPTPTVEPDPTTNFLLLGYGGGKHDGAYLTDTMMLVRIDPVRKKTFLISLPRDLWVNLPVSSQGKGSKINAAYAYGLDDAQFPDKPKQYMGSEGARTMVRDIVSQVTGVTIQHVAAVDFSGFVKGIDTIGGVDVTVPQSFTDQEYPIDGKETDLCGKKPEDLPELEKIATVSATAAFPCRYETVSFTKGITHMDGTTALKFVRSRHAPGYGSDFSRSERQRNLIVAVKNKLLSLGGLSKLPEFYRNIAGNISTDLSITDLAGLIPSAKPWTEYDIVSVGLSDENVLDPFVTSDGQFALASLEGEYKWGLVKTFLADEVRPERAKKAPLTLLKTPRMTYTELMAYKRSWDETGIPIVDTAFVPGKAATESSLTVSGNVDQMVVAAIRQRIPGLIVQTSGSAPTSGTSLVLTVAVSPTPSPTPAPAGN